MLDYDDLLLYWSQMMQIGEIARLVSDHFDHVLVDEYQDTNALQASILLGLKPDGVGHHRRRRRRPGDLFLPLRHGAQHPRFSQPLRPASRGGAPRTELPVDPAHPGSLQPNHCPGRRALHQEPFHQSRTGRPPAAPGDDCGRDRASRLRDPAHPGQPRIGMELRDQVVLFRVSHHASQLEVELARRYIPFVKFGGLKFLEAGPRQGRPRRPALGGKPARPRRRSSRPQADPRYRAGNGAPGSRGFRAGRPRFLDAGVLPASRGSRQIDGGSRRRRPQSSW